jgi:hypothetical protein
MKKLLLIATHAMTLGAGFAVGVYALPILTASTGPSVADVAAQASVAAYKGQFRRDSERQRCLALGRRHGVGREPEHRAGRQAGARARLQAVPVAGVRRNEADFNRLKPSMQRVGEVKTFENFLVQLPSGVDVSRFNTVIVWCETFGQFISAAKYR